MRLDTFHPNGRIPFGNLQDRVMGVQTQEGFSGENKKEKRGTDASLFPCYILKLFIDFQVALPEKEADGPRKAGEGADDEQGKICLFLFHTVPYHLAYNSD